MQPQPLPPRLTTPESNQHIDPSDSAFSPAPTADQDSPSPATKKSVLGKVKDKAKGAKGKALKLKTKIKQKTPGFGNGENGEAGSSESSSEEEEVASDQSQQSIGQQAFDTQPGSGQNRGSLQERLGQLNLGTDRPEGGDQRLQEEMPSAPGQRLAGVTPYLAAHDFKQSDKEGKEHLLVSTTGTQDQEPASKDEDMEYVKPDFDENGESLTELPEGAVTTNVGKTDEVVRQASDNEGAWYIPPTENRGQAEKKPLKDRAIEGLTAAKDTVAGAAAATAGALGYGVSKKTEQETQEPSGEKKSILEQAREKIFGSKKSLSEGSQPQSPTIGGEQQQEKSATDEVPSGESKPGITSRAAGTVLSLKDTLASKLGYGDSKPATESAEGGDQARAMEIDSSGGDQKPKSYVQKLQDSAVSAKEAGASKLGYGEQKAGEGDDPQQQQEKSYLQQMQEKAIGAKEAVASRLGYGFTTAAAGDEATRAGDELVDKHRMNAAAPSRFHPSEEDRALSQLITETMSSSAATVKETLFRPFSSSPKNVGSAPSPAAAAGGAAEEEEHAAMSRDVPARGGDESSKQAEAAGIVGRVSGAVSSLLSSSSKKVSSSSSSSSGDEAAGKASNDSTAASGVCTVQQVQ